VKREAARSEARSREERASEARNTVRGGMEREPSDICVFVLVFATSHGLPATSYKLPPTTYQLRPRL
jgi:hypothetical protein